MSNKNTHPLPTILCAAVLVAGCESGISPSNSESRVLHFLGSQGCVAGVIQSQEIQAGYEMHGAKVISATHHRDLIAGRLGEQMHLALGAIEVQGEAQLLDMVANDLKIRCADYDYTEASLSPIGIDAVVGDALRYAKDKGGPAFIVVKSNRIGLLERASRHPEQGHNQQPKPTP